ncbi:MAG: hypothetical protein Q8908_04170 [Bacteroidota bacterium]|nr:hypothetical protein [Bacteroidota bacterium]
MKKIVTSVVVILSALTACTVINQGQSYDDVYYNPNDKSTVAVQENPGLHKSSKAVIIKTDSNTLSGKTIGQLKDANTLSSDSYVTSNNNSFNYDDYYDYSYASRIRRFQYAPFNDYYNDYYTNRYWYNYDPMYWGSSIYSSWGWSPSMSFYMSPFSMSWGIYSPFNSFYDPFYDPFMFGYGYYPYGFGYNNYMMGYYNGFYDGYYGYYGLGYGRYGYGGGGYSNSLDKNASVYYGPKRNTLGSNNGPTPTERVAFSQRYTAFSGGGASGVSSAQNAREVINNNASASAITSGQKDKGVTTTAVTANQREAGSNNLFGTTNATTQRTATTLNRKDVNRYISNSARDQQIQGKRVDIRSLQQQSNNFKDRTVGTQNVNGNVRYVKPQQSSAPQQYYSPVYSRPRSSNEYSSPGYRNPAIYNSRQFTPQQRSVSDPQRYVPQRVYSAPSGNSGNRGEVSNYNNYRQVESSYPSSSYSSPRSTYSAPASTYSAPSQTYSAPAGNARESGSSSSSSGSTYTGPRR